MRHSKRSYFFAALIAGLLSSFAPRAHADTAIQMLPPLNFDYKTTCGGVAGSPQVLAWDGVNPINCIPLVTGNSSGTLTAPTITSTKIINSSTIANSQSISSNSLATNVLFLPNIFAANAFVDVTNTITDLAAMGGCTNGAALTKNTNGTFGCINVADIPNVGTTYVQQCSTPGTMLYFDNAKGFSCQPIPFPATPPFPPTCTGSNVLQFDGTSYACVASSAVVTAAPVPPACYDNYHALRSPDGVHFVCSPTACHYDGNYVPYFPAAVPGTLPVNLTTASWVPMNLSLWHYRGDGGLEGITCVDPINNTFQAFSNLPGTTTYGIMAGP